MTDPRDEERRAELLARDARLDAVRGEPAIERIAASLTERAAAFHPWIDGAESRFADVAAVLAGEPDRDRREAAWWAAAPLGEELESETATLFALRNRAARELGALAFPEIAFETLGIGRIDYLALCDELQELTREPWEDGLGRLRDFLAVPNLEPWDLDHGFRALAGGGEPPRRDRFPDLLGEALSGWGVDSAALPVRHVATDSAAPFVVLPVDPAADIRIAADFRDDRRSLSAWLRAHGEALHHHRAAGAAAPFDRDRSPLPAATGALVERLAVPPEPADAAARIYALRRAVARSLFEILAYERPDGDLHSLHCEIAEHYLGFPRHPERLWAADTAFVSRPFSSVKAVLAEVIAAQFHAALTERFGDPRSREAGDALDRAVLTPGDAIPWPDRVAALAGAPLDPGPLLTELGAETLDG